MLGHHIAVVPPTPSYVVATTRKIDKPKEYFLSRPPRMFT
jgi:hypothetical protein